MSQGPPASQCAYHELPSHCHRRGTIPVACCRLDGREPAFDHHPRQMLLFRNYVDELESVQAPLNSNELQISFTVICGVV